MLNMILTTEMTNGYQLMTVDKANALVKTMNEEDDDLIYKAKHCPKGTGLSFVEIYEGSELLGKL